MTCSGELYRLIFNLNNFAMCDSGEYLVGLPVIRLCAGVSRWIPYRLSTQIADVTGIRVPVRQSGKMRDRVNPEANSQHDETAGNPYWPAEGGTQVANDQQSRCSSDLIGGRYPGRVAAGQCKSAFYSWYCDSKQSIHSHGLTERSHADQEQKPSRVN